MKRLKCKMSHRVHTFFRITLFTYFTLALFCQSTSSSILGLGAKQAEAQAIPASPYTSNNFISKSPLREGQVPGIGSFSNLENAIDAVNNKMRASLYYFLARDTAAQADNIAPPIPALLGPANGSSVLPIGLELDWSDVADSSNPVTYVFQASLNAIVGTANDLLNPMFTSGTLNNSVIIASPTGTYYWQVKACDSAKNCSAWSGPWKVTVRQ